MTRSKRTGRLPVILALGLLPALLPGASQALGYVDPGPPAPEVHLDRSGLGELVLGQALLGSLAGGALTLSITDGAPEVSLVEASGFVLGLGAGIALPLVLTRGRPVPTAQAVFTNQLERLGLVNGMLLAMALHGSGFDLEDPLTTALPAALGLVGLGVGLLFWDELQLTPGQASTIGFGLLGGFVTSTLGLAAFGVIDDPQGYPMAQLIIADAGVAIAWLVAENLEVGRARVLWATAGGIVGMGLTGTLGLLVAGGEQDPVIVLGSGLAGFWAGALATWLLLPGLDGWKERAGVASTAVFRLDDEGLAVGRPAPRILQLPAVEPGGPAQVAATVDLLEVSL